MASKPRYNVNDWRPAVQSLGKRSFGKAKLYCTFLQEETKWGVVKRRGQDRPAAILHVKIAFEQPHGYKLREAFVTFTLKEASAESSLRSEPVSNLSTTARTQGSGPLERRLLHVTGELAPELLCSMPLTASEGREKKFMPEMGAGFGPQFNFAGVGVANKTEYQQNYRWEFRTYLSIEHPMATTKHYIGATCSWAANPKNKSVELIGPLRAAITIEHDEEPFSVELTVTGKLVNPMKDVLQKLKFWGRTRTDNTELQPILEDRENELEWDLKGLMNTIKKANGVEIPETGEPVRISREERFVREQADE